MINVDNSYKKRIFVNKFTKEVLDLKERVENRIKEIEESDFNYSLLNAFELDINKNHISVFRYKEVIVEKIEELKLNITDINFRIKLDDIKNNIYLILVGDFSKMKFFLDNNINTLLVHRTENDKTNDFKEYQKVFEDLYKSELSSSSFKKSFFNLFDEVNACPYCNRNYINPIHKKEKFGKDNQNQAPDIEHFFPKSIYPFLSLSISNLIPSCAFCNKIKSDYDTYNTCKSPYEIKGDEIKFKFEIIDNQKRIIKVDSKDNIKNIEVLNLDDLYERVHSKYVNDIFLDVKKHPIENRKYLQKFFSLSVETQDKLYKRKFCNYYRDEDFNKQPLSKMTKDLFFHIKENEVK